MHPIVIGLDALHDFGDRLLQNLEIRSRINADPERPGYQWQHVSDLARVEILEVLVLRVRDGAEHGALVEPEQIGCAKHDAGDGKSRPQLGYFKRSLQNRE